MIKAPGKPWEATVRAAFVLLMAGVLVAAQTGPGHAQDAAAPSAEKLAAAREVLEATGAVKKLDAVIDHPNLVIVKGNILDHKAVCAALRSHEALLVLTREDCEPAGGNGA